MHNKAIQLLHTLPGTSVLCAGDIMLDNFIYGEATRLSPEAPIPIVRVKRKTSMPGGVGNVVRNLGELGVLPLAVSVVGNDDNSRILADHFLNSGWLPPILVRDANRPTIVKTRVIAGIQQVVRIDEEESSPLSEQMADRFVEAVKRHIGGVKSLAVSDYGKGVVTRETAATLIKLARENGLPIVVDPKGKDYGKYSGATLITPNRKELAEASGRDVSDERGMADAGRELMRKCSIDNILITRSEDGMMLITGNDPGNPICLPAKAKAVFDVSGAGDTVVAVMAAALAAGASLQTGAELATLAAGVVVGKVGTAVAYPHEIEAAE